jgi:RimJ/RimL family protein N-acetyltransferase
MRKAVLNDINTYFNWANEDSVRKLSFNSEKIAFQDHQVWFENRLKDENCFMYVFYTHVDIGQVRIQKITNKDAIINISLDKKFRGKGYGVKMLNMSIEVFRKTYPSLFINAYVKTENIASKNIFEKAGFTLNTTLIYKNIYSYHFIKI